MSPCRKLKLVLVGLKIQTTQIPYDLTFNRNLINKTNKQAKYNQDTEIENRLTVTRRREEGISGEKGKGFAGAIIKDTWIITRGCWKQGREVGRAGVLG